MTQFEYQRTHRYFAQIAQGFEEPAVSELSGLGAGDIRVGFRGLYFTADQTSLYNINYRARLITRVLAPLAEFACPDRDALYGWARSFEWHCLFNVDQTFALFASVNGNPSLTHSKFAALCLKDGIVDAFRDRFHRRPNVDTETPDVWLNLHIEKEKAIVSLDTSGGSLHRRGYRRQSVPAPMQETLAAAIVSLTGWQGDIPLMDPMCGSGTLLCEALMVSGNIPAGYLRKSFGFQFLPDFDPQLWMQLKKAADNDIRLSGIRHGCRRRHRCRCRQSCPSQLPCLPGGKAIPIRQVDYLSIANLENHVIITNPPYGIRMGREATLDFFYKQLGDFLKQRCKGSQAYVYFGNRDMIKKIGLKPAWKKPLRNGGLDGRLVKYELY